MGRSTSLCICLCLSFLTVDLVQTKSLLLSSELIKPVTNHSSVQADGDVYLFAVEGTRNPYSFENEDGKLVGFEIDVISSVCALAHKTCYAVLAYATDCLFRDRGVIYAGRGLMSGWFQGCPGYQITTEMGNEFDFTVPYLQSTPTFYVLPGNPAGFNPTETDYSDFKILHLTGDQTNSACLSRVNDKLGKILQVATLQEALAMIHNRTADALVSPRRTIEGLEAMPANTVCAENHTIGMMLKKGSTLVSWWNPAFQKFYLSGVYTQMCEASKQKYGKPAMCLPPPNEASPSLMALMTTPSKVEADKKLWLFVVSGRLAPYSFLDKDGNLVGFTKDFIQNVCKIAGKRCTLITAEVHECTRSEDELLLPGRGMLDGWFDACTGYFNTVDRFNSWDFTSPYLLSNASFYVAPGNPTKFNASSDDYSDHVIVYTATAISNNHCLHRLHKKVKKLMRVKRMGDAINAVLSGKADAWFTKRYEVSVLDRLPERFHCENVGTSVMVRKGSPLPSWWNPAFGNFYRTGQYNQFCATQAQMYNYNFPCIPYKQ